MKKQAIQTPIKETEILPAAEQARYDDWEQNYQDSQTYMEYKQQLLEKAAKEIEKAAAKREKDQAKVTNAAKKEKK